MSFLNQQELDRRDCCLRERECSSECPSASSTAQDNRDRPSPERATAMSATLSDNGTRTVVAKSRGKYSHEEEYCVVQGLKAPLVCALDLRESAPFVRGRLTVNLPRTLDTSKKVPKYCHPVFSGVPVLTIDIKKVDKKEKHFLDSLAIVLNSGDTESATLGDAEPEKTFHIYFTTEIESSKYARLFAKIRIKGRLTKDKELKVGTMEAMEVFVNEVCDMVASSAPELKPTIVDFGEEMMASQKSVHEVLYCLAERGDIDVSVCELEQPEATKQQSIDSNQVDVSSDSDTGTKRKGEKKVQVTLHRVPELLTDGSRSSKGMVNNLDTSTYAATDLDISPFVAIDEQFGTVLYQYTHERHDKGRRVLPGGREMMQGTVEAQQKDALHGDVTNNLNDEITELGVHTGDQLGVPLFSRTRTVKTLTNPRHSQHFSPLDELIISSADYDETSDIPQNRGEEESKGTGKKALRVTTLPRGRSRHSKRISVDMANNLNTSTCVSDIPDLDSSPFVAISEQFGGALVQDRAKHGRPVSESQNIRSEVTTTISPSLESDHKRVQTGKGLPHLAVITHYPITRASKGSRVEVENLNGRPYHVTDLDSSPFVAIGEQFGTTRVQDEASREESVTDSPPIYREDVATISDPTETPVISDNTEERKRVQMSNFVPPVAVASHPLSGTRASKGMLVEMVNNLNAGPHGVSDLDSSPYVAMAEQFGSHGQSVTESRNVRGKVATTVSPSGEAPVIADDEHKSMQTGKFLPHLTVTPHPRTGSRTSKESLVEMLKNLNAGSHHLTDLDSSPYVAVREQFRSTRVQGQARHGQPAIKPRPTQNTDDTSTITPPIGSELRKAEKSFPLRRFRVLPLSMRPSKGMRIEMAHNLNVGSHNSSEVDGSPFVAIREQYGRGSVDGGGMQPGTVTEVPREKGAIAYAEESVIMMEKRFGHRHTRKSMYSRKVASSDIVLPPLEVHTVSRNVNEEANTERQMEKCIQSCAPPVVLLNSGILSNGMFTMARNLTVFSPDGSPYTAIERAFLQWYKHAGCDSAFTMAQVEEDSGTQTMVDKSSSAGIINVEVSFKYLSSVDPCTFNIQVVGGL